MRFRLTLTVLLLKQTLSRKYNILIVNVIGPENSLYTRISRDALFLESRNWRSCIMNIIINIRLGVDGILISLLEVEPV